MAGPTRYDIPLRFASFTPEWTGVSRPGAPQGARPGAIGAGEATVPPGLRAPPTNDVYIVQFVTQPLQEYRDAIAAVGGTIHHWLAYHSYVVQMSPQARAQVAAMPFVRWVGPLHVAYRIDPALITPGMAAGMPSNEPSTARRYNLMVNRRGLVDKEPVAAAIELIGGRVDFGVHEYGFVLGATLTEAQVLTVVRLKEVSFLDPGGEPALHTDIAREISGANYLETVRGFRGQGVRGEVMDANILGEASGGIFVSTHLAFDQHAPIVHGDEVFPIPPPGDPTICADFNSDQIRAHGTSTFGIIFGSQPATSSPPFPGFNGMAPDAEGIFATLLRYEDNPQYPSCYPAGQISREKHLAQLVDPDGPFRAVFQTNSWGTGMAPPGPFLTTAYTTLAAMMDDILLRNDLTVLRSFGNQGTADNPRATAQECWCKNELTVGGIKHRNTFDRSDDEWNPKDLVTCNNQLVRVYPYCPSPYPPACFAGCCAQVPVCPECACLNYPICPSCVRNCCFECGPILGSTIGPAADGRVKPDLVHFYDAVNAPGRSICEGFSNTTYNANFGGTSAATPIAAGCVALLQQMVHEQVFPGFGGGSSVFDDRVHSSTVKALLVNSAYQYAFGSGPSADLNRDTQGWGMPNLTELYDARETMVIIDESEPLLTTGAKYELQVTTLGTPFKVTLVYRDPAGTPGSAVHRKNDLNLYVYSATAEYYGNYGLSNSVWSVSGGGADDRNTVENVFVEAPGSGPWTVKVIAAELNEDGDPSTPELDTRFALVVSGVVGGSPVMMRPDWNRDGVVDVADLQAFLSDFAAGKADADRDGRTTASDVATFVGALLERLPGEK